MICHVVLHSKVAAKHRNRRWRRLMNFNKFGLGTSLGLSWGMVKFFPLSVLLPVGTNMPILKNGLMWLIISGRAFLWSPVP